MEEIEKTPALKYDFTVNNNIIQFKPKGIKTIFSNSQDKELEEMKNVRVRKDGRYEFRKMINGTKIFIIEKSREKFFQEVRKIKQKFKDTIKQTVEKNKVKYNFKDECKQWIDRYKAGIKSIARYNSVFKNYFDELNTDVKNLNKDILQDFLNDFTTHRNAAYAYYIIKGTCADLTEKGIFKKDIALNLKAPENKTIKGCNFNLEEQKLIINNLDKTPIAEEILFYVLTGLRRSEARNITPNFEKKQIYAEGTKTQASKRYISLSESYSNRLKQKINSMFNNQIDYYTKEFKKYLKLLEIDETKRLYDLRHTFATNIYYLGANDKLRQYLMGHASIVMTNDIYTHIDPSIIKEDIIEIYGDLYPKYD